jgi:hypothetical protein
LHDYGTKYDAITFMGVLHEVYSAHGLSSVVKLLCDAHELLNYGGALIIRDMIRPHNSSNMAERMALYNKLESNPNVYPWLTDYQSQREMVYMNIESINDFLLHMLYTDNWANEIQERYMFWTAEEYMDFGRMLGMELVDSSQCYLLDYVKEQWRRELWLNDMEMSSLYSTGVVALRKY